MRIIHIVPGSGGTFYCQNCLRDNALVKALRALGHDVVMVPLYLPMFADENETHPGVPVFYGAISLYLKQQWPWLRKAPASLERLLNSPRLLAWAARKSGSTRARGLEAMTLSMLRGEQGQQADELEHLIGWLKSETRPDVVHLSNALLLGLARRIQRELNTTVICSLQDEDTWLDAMRPEAARQAWQLIGERAADVDVFTAVSRYYADRIHQRTGIPQAKIAVVPVGIDLTGFAPAPAPPTPPALGYLSRLAESLGLGMLIEAFIRLKADPRFAALKLRATGGQTGDDTQFLERMRQRLAAAHLTADVEFLPEFDRSRRMEFLRSLTVLSVPAPQGEAFGTYVLEANAAGVPVVQPDLGAFPEILAITGGGVLYTPNTVEALAAKLAPLLADPGAARALGERGRRVVLEQGGIERMAQLTEAVYRQAQTR